MNYPSLYRKVVATPVKFGGGVHVKSAKGFIIGLGICVIMVSVLAQALIMSNSLVENSAFRGICPLH